MSVLSGAEQKEVSTLDKRIDHRKAFDRRSFVRDCPSPRPDQRRLVVCPPPSWSELRKFVEAWSSPLGAFADSRMHSPTERERSIFSLQSSISWPAISDIWLGIRTVSVLSVAKESRGASQIAHWPRSARTQAGRCGLTDRRSSVKKLLGFVRLLMFPSLLEEITGHGMPVECSKLTCFAKVKIRHGSRAVRSTIEVGRC